MKGKIFIAKGRWIVSRDLEWPASEVWRAITDTNLWPVWGPSVTSVECPDRFITPSSRGQVRTALGFRVPFTITRFTEGHYWSWQIGKFEATGHRVIPLSRQTCRLEFEMPWWSAPYSLVCALALRRLDQLLSISSRDRDDRPPLG